MKKVISLLLCMLLCGTTLVFATTQNDTTSIYTEPTTTDWWPIQFHDYQRTQYTTSDGPETNNIMTSFSTTGTTNFFIINDGIIYSCDGSKTYAYDATTGIEINSINFGSQKPILLSSDRLFIISSLGLTCINKDPTTWTGTPHIWYNFVSGETIMTSPVVVGDTIYIGTHGPSANIHYFNAATGTDLGSVPVGSSIYPPSEFAVLGEKIYTLGGQELICFDTTTNTVAWQTTVTTSPDIFNFAQTPTISNNILFAISMSGQLFALDLTNQGAILWQYNLGSQYVGSDSIAVAYGQIYVGISNKLLCINLTNPTIPAWSYNYNNKPTRYPIVADHKVYFLVDTVGISCVQTNDGSFVWTSDKLGSVCPIAVNGILYHASGNKIYLYNANHAPGTPTFDGPHTVTKNVPTSFFVNATDLDGDMIYYRLQWAPNTFTEYGPYPSGVQQEIIYTYTIPHTVGTKNYNIRCWAKDVSCGVLSATPAGPHTITITNHGPDDPVITGPTQVFVGEWIYLNITVSDPDNDNNLALGEEIVSGSPPTTTWQWSGNYDSGTIIEKSFKITAPQVKIFRFKVGERNGYGGAPVAESSIVSYSVNVIQNNAPTVPVVAGPSEGVIGTECSFTATSTDPDGHDIKYTFNWGEGSITTEYYPSGTPAEAKHTWTTPGTYAIEVTPRDELGKVGNPGYHTITIKGPELEIGEITGGMLKIDAEIKNIGTVDAENITWNIKLGGGGIFLAGKEVSGTISQLTAGNTEIILDKPVLGFGKLKATVTISGDNIEEITKTVEGFVLLFYIVIQ